MRISDWSSDVCSSDLARRAPADVGVVAARADVEQQLLAGIVEHRRDHRDVGQVGAAVVGRVQRIDVTRPHGRPEIGRASCRERVCQYVYISVVAVYLTKKKTT